ncbi:response regulator [candidate division WOR-3 bacterium]|nr:response regulator [candidate division WOR-3 bacterium]
MKISLDFTRTKDKIIGFSIVFSLFYWITDAFLSYFFLYYEGSLLGMLILDIPINVLYLRSIVSVLFIASGILISKLFEKREYSETIQLILYKISYAVNTTENLNELFKEIHQHLGKVVDTTNFYIALYNKEKDIIELPYYVDEKDEITEFPPGKTLTAYVIKNDKPLLATIDVMQKLKEAGEIESMDSFSEEISISPAEVWLGAPLKIEDEVIGAIAVQSYTDASLYNEKDLDILKMVSGQVAIAIKRKQATETIETSEKEKAIILDSLSELVTYMDKDLEIVWANNAAGESVGFDPNELIGQHCYEVWHQRNESCEECPVLKAIETGEFQLGELTTPDGRKWLVRGTPVKNENGEVVGVVESTLNITERKRLEERLIQSQKMETVGRLAGGVAHDFNNLLTAITGYANFIKDGLLPLDPKREDVKQILKAADRAITLTDRLLAFSRRKPINPKVININDLIVEIDKMLRRIITEDIELVAFPGENLGSVRADPGSIEQVIVNLVVNARDAMLKGGKLTIKTENVTIDEDFVHKHIGSKIGKYVRITIRDTGIGMAKEVVEHVFEPFFTTKGEGKGTGLGLSTVYGIVKQHDGYIAVDSILDKGTTVDVYLPRVYEEAEKITLKERDETLPEGNETILFVEDEGLVRSFGVRVLERLGYNVIAASDGEEAINLAREHDGEIHLLLTDLVMPKIDGKELAKQLIAERPNVKVLYVSGYSEEITLQHGILSDETNFLQKPFSTVDLAQKVREVIDETGGFQRTSSFEF